MKITNKDVKMYKYRIVVPYAELSELLKNDRIFRELGYNAGVYGWNYTAYIPRFYSEYDVVISSGYRNFIGYFPAKAIEKAKKQIEQAEAKYGWTNYNMLVNRYESIAKQFIKNAVAEMQK